MGKWKAAGRVIAVVSAVFVLGACGGGPPPKPKPAPIYYRLDWSALYKGRRVEASGVIACEPVYASFGAGERGRYGRQRNTKSISLRLPDGAAVVILAPAICDDHDLVDRSGWKSTGTWLFTTPAILLDRWPGTTRGVGYISPDAFVAKDAEIRLPSSRIELLDAASSHNLNAPRDLIGEIVFGDLSLPLSYEKDARGRRLNTAEERARAYREHGSPMPACGGGGQREMSAIGAVEVTADAYDFSPSEPSLSSDGKLALYHLSQVVPSRELSDPYGSSPPPRAHRILFGEALSGQVFERGGRGVTFDPQWTANARDQHKRTFPVELRDGWLRIDPEHPGRVGVQMIHSCSPAQIKGVEISGRRVIRPPSGSQFAELVLNDRTNGRWFTLLLR